MTCGIDNYSYAFYHGCVIDAGHKCIGLSSADADGVRLSRNTIVADVDVVTARSKVEAGPIAQRDVRAAGGVAIERIHTARRVGATGGITIERGKTIGRVVVAGSVAVERNKALGRVVAAGHVTIERVVTYRGVVVAGSVEIECVNPHCRVLGTGGVAK